jgi:hypothetical protein
MVAAIFVSACCAGAAGWLVRLVTRKALALVAFAAGAAGSVFLASIAWAPISDWYNLSRCRDGVANACMRLSIKRPTADADNFYAPRRACALGKVYACASMFRWAPDRRAEICESGRRICAEEANPVMNRAACALVADECQPEQHTGAD